MTKLDFASNPTNFGYINSINFCFSNGVTQVDTLLLIQDLFYFGRLDRGKIIYNKSDTHHVVGLAIFKKVSRTQIETIGSISIDQPPVPDDVSAPMEATHLAVPNTLLVAYNTKIALTAASWLGSFNLSFISNGCETEMSHVVLSDLPNTERALDKLIPKNSTLISPFWAMPAENFYDSPPEGTQAVNIMFLNTPDPAVVQNIFGFAEAVPLLDAPSVIRINLPTGEVEGLNDRIDLTNSILPEPLIRGFYTDPKMVHWSGIFNTDPTTPDPLFPYGPGLIYFSNLRPTHHNLANLRPVFEKLKVNPESARWVSGKGSTRPLLAIWVPNKALYANLPKVIAGIQLVVTHQPAHQFTTKKIYLIPKNKKRPSRNPPGHLFFRVLPGTPRARYHY